ncbi:MAG TPA: sugar O-acetyltransferase [Candidatus Egerieicola pullicola]|uniref:Acetyltransferase n=1 Tax=Candidatus Egerieicola pullicola TaxID=2840775 RepID=A0A9D1AIH6_9FIRM|nr:sugar O-acetyltransferase [Candidatus Egerieicola pullicola]
MTQKERMLAGLPYRANDPELKQMRAENKLRVAQYNQLTRNQEQEMDQLIKEILGGTGKEILVEPPIHFDYGRNTTVGERFFANYNLTVLDVCPVTIGDNVMIAPNVSLYGAGHPIHPDARNSGYEYGAPITIGNNVWIGGSVCVLPGVTIGNNVVIGAGSVVAKDIPDNVIAVGNPCRVIREITEEDKKYYFKDKEFDVEWEGITPQWR